MKKNNIQPIAPSLKNLEKNKTISFPLSQSQSVRSTIQALKTQFIDLAIDFETKKNIATKMLDVTRIS